MNADIENGSVVLPDENYLKDRQRLLSLSTDTILEHILNHRNPDALVKSFPQEDFYFLIHDIGPEDSLELLAMASAAQWEYILDLESWQRDRVDLAALTKWFRLLLKADPMRLVQWLLKDNPELFEFYLFRNIEVIVREHDQDPADFGKDFFTFDDVYYIRIGGNRSGAESQTAGDKMLDDVLPLLLERLAEFDHIKFQQVLLETRSMIPAETEEEVYRLRNVRLAEKGFLPLDEALGVYHYLDPGALKTGPSKIAAGAPDRREALPVPIYPSRMMQSEGLFSRALRIIEGDEQLQQLQIEFAALCNRIITADQIKVHDRDALRNIVKKACGYLSIGLGRLLDLKTLPSGQQKKFSAANLTRFPLLEIFRVGFGSALELKWRADKWLSASWFKDAGLPLSFWGESWLGVLGGLLLKRPLYYDNYKTGTLYREFSANEDVLTTEEALDAIIAFDRLLSLLHISLKPFSANTLLNHKNLVLTLWGRHYLNLAKDFWPLTLDEFKRLFTILWIDTNPPRRIRQPVKTSFLNWLAEETGLEKAEISLRLGDTLGTLFDEIESEYGCVSEADLDPKYIQMFLIQKTKDAV